MAAYFFLVVIDDCGNAVFPEQIFRREILQQVVGGKTMMAFWYHFAILFEALFILTAVDAGTASG